MARKITGTIILLMGSLLGLVLLMYGGPVFPHIFGSIVLIAIGLPLVIIKKKGI